MTPPAKCAPVPEALAPFLLNRAACVVRRMAEAELAPFHINPRHYGILATISAHGPLTQHSLGELMQIDRTTIVQLVDELEELGVVVRGRTPGDRRSYSLSLTREGQSLLRKTGPCMLATQELFLQSLTVPERKELQRLLTKVLARHAEPTTLSQEAS